MSGIYGPFKVDGPIVGAVRTTQRMKWCDPRYKRYEAFKEAIRYAANLAGVPQELDGPAVVHIGAHWKRGPRVDLDNAIKSALDSMWKQDRRVDEIRARNFPNQKVEELWIEVMVL